MIKSIKHALAFWLVSAVAIGFLAPLRAADNPADKPAAKPTDKPATAPAAAKKPKRRGVPFTGKLELVDKVAKTITVKGKEKGRVIHITSQTRIVKAGKPATLEEGVVGEEVSGYGRLVGEEKLEAISVRFGPRPEGEGSRAKSKDGAKAEPKAEEKREKN